MDNAERAMYLDRIFFLVGLVRRLGIRFDGPNSYCRECGVRGERGPIGTPEANTPIITHWSGCALAALLGDDDDSSQKVR